MRVVVIRLLLLASVLAPLGLAVLLLRMLVVPDPMRMASRTWRREMEENRVRWSRSGRNSDHTYQANSSHLEKN